MAVSKIPNPNIISDKRTDNPSSGTSSATVLSCHQIKYGKMVFVSARIKWNQNVTGAMNIPLLALDRFKPAETATGFTPSFLCASGETYADLVYIKKYDTIFYAQQSAKSSCNKDSTVEMFFCYETID